MSEYLHSPHPGVLGMMGRWVRAGGHGHDVQVGMMGGWEWHGGWSKSANIRNLSTKLHI